MRRSFSKPFCCLVAVLPLALAVPSTAGAAEPTPAEISAARHLFEEGQAAADAGRWREAADKFRRAISIKDTPGLRFHLARAQAEHGALVEALVEYDRARELLDQGIKAPDVERLLPEARAKLKARLGQLVVSLPQGVSELSVELDGKPVTPTVLGVPLPVNPGAHRLRAAAPGHRPFSAELVVSAGEVKQLAIELVPVAPVASEPAPPSASIRTAARGNGDAIPGRTVMLVGQASLFAAALTTGIVFSIKRSAAGERYDAANRLIVAQLDDSTDLDSACRAKLDGCAQLAEAQSDRSEAGAVSTIAFVVAGTSAAAFGLTYWLWPDETRPVAVKAGAAPGELALSVSGRF